MHRDIRNVYKMLVGEFEKIRHIWDGNIKNFLKEIVL
jgi:hypothetical protein